MRAFWAVLALILGSCAGLPALDPPRVSFSGVEDVGFEGMEMRMLIKLRVQNPNGLPIAYEGIDVKLDIEGATVARGVSNASGSIPGYGESVVALPVSVSILDLGRQALRLFRTNGDRLHYVLEGKLGSPIFGATRFRSQGELSLPMPSPRQSERAANPADEQL